MAYRLSLRKKQLLVSIHVLSVVAWFGGAMCMLLLGLYMKHADNGEQLYATLSNMHLIDITLIRYPAIMVFVTGIMLSIWTQWGLIKYYWVVIKLVLTIMIIFMGIMYLSDWLSFLLKTAEHDGIVALQNDAFQTTSVSLISASIFNIFAMIMMTCVTYFKPFGKIKKKR